MEEHIMQRDEKNMQTRRKIMASAVHEFALHGYEAASMNTICQQGGISKGIIYHYFESKEALYLACVLECFQALTNVLQDKIMTSPETASSKKTASDGDALLDLYFSVCSTKPLKKSRTALDTRGERLRCFEFDEMAGI